MFHYLDIDPAAAAPIWRQIEDGMRRLVASGTVPGGAVVPSVRELAKELRINPATVSKAYRRLTDDGLLIVRRGEGTFVVELSENNRALEKQRLLKEGAESFVQLAHSIGATQGEAQRAISNSWPDETNDGEGEVK